jgi:prephenate dehydratase
VLKLDDIKRIYSHPVANAQCSRFLKTRNWEIINYLDTASCVEKIKKENVKDAAAIASKRAAEVYDVDILVSNIQNDDNNFTRFFVISKTRSEEEGNKTSIVIGLRDGLNALYDYLGFLVKRGIKIVLIQSRPSRRLPFEYVIYVDFMGSPSEQKVREAMADLLVNCSFVKFIGSYKADKKYFS